VANITAADTIFDHPLYSEWNPSPSTDTPLGGRLMSSSPHTDGLLLVPPSAFMTALGSNQTGATVRNAKGDWSYTITASAAGTVSYVRVAPELLLRLGEQYILELFPNLGNKTESPAAPAKGIQITDVFAVFCTLTALPTALTLRLATTQYPAEAATLGNTGTVPTFADVVAATSILPTSLTTGSTYYVTQGVAVTTPAFITTDITLGEIELAFTPSASSTLAIAALGVHLNFNFN
jgi:hypothetical protein